ncbi:MAG TPA: glycerol-3-phosphate 1-O-acyltransferase PlsY [Burkholderiales bacterium]|nr:glycerol-3-phosphate 1-O-acyltransferase PlsY [Burkholderiales bacterium]
MQTALVVLAAYVLGSVSFAIVVSRALGLPDPRSYGSRNPGATNVLRTGRRAAAVLTLLGDAAKGWLAVWLAGLYTGETALTGWVVPLAGLAAFLGHLFPVFHRFRGGKGVATAAGVLLGLNLWLGAATAVTWVAMAVFFRYSSLAALVAALFAPAYAFWLFGLRPVLAVVLVLAALLVWRHKANILRLVAGQEQRIGAKPRAGSPEAPQ